LCDTLEGRVRELNYKTIRYVGHCEPMKLLVNELRLSECRTILKDILERAVPVTFQDVVVTFCTAVGLRNGQLVQITDGRKVYHQDVGGQHWSAIQITTAASVCAVLDLFTAGSLPQRGFVSQEQVDFDAFITNRFGKQYDSPTSARLHDEWRDSVDDMGRR
jgi:saccharopine dehydrogenase-like NADP-dependent oxidoreductase